MNPSFSELFTAAACVCGTFHTHRGSPCEDAWFMAADDTHRTIVLCDGCSTASKGAAAARIVSQTAGAILHQNFTAYLYKDPLAIRVEAARAVEAALTGWARQNQIEARQLAATLVAASMDREGRFICLHMGDGGILGQSAGSKQILRVSLPENRLGSRQTYLTMNCSMARHLRICRQTSSDLESLLLYTDFVHRRPGSFPPRPLCALDGAAAFFRHPGPAGGVSVLPAFCGRCQRRPAPGCSKKGISFFRIPCVTLSQKNLSPQQEGTIHAV